MAEITGQVHHVNFSVSDLARSVAWYSQLFEMATVAQLDDEGARWAKVILRDPSGLLVGLTAHRSKPRGALRRTPQRPRPRGLRRVRSLCPGRLGAASGRARRRALADQTDAPRPLITPRDPDNIQLEVYAPTQ